MLDRCITCPSKTNSLSGFCTNNLVDSAYVNARVDLNLSLDSAEAVAIVDSAYVQTRQNFEYSELIGAPTTVSSFTNDANYLDSTTATDLMDSAYIQARQITYDFLDSSEAIALIDSAHVQARQVGISSHTTQISQKVQIYITHNLDSMMH